MCFEDYQTRNGVLANKWSDLEGFINRPLDEYFHYAPPNKRYTFVDGVGMLPPLEGDMLLVARKAGYEITLSDGILPMETHLKGPGRYVIFRNSKGEFRAKWLDERDIVRTFAAAERALPIPDNEPEPSPIKKARQEILLRRSIYTAIIVVPLGIWWIWAKRRYWKPRAT